MIGTVLGGRYTILEEVGKGGMAHVYKAHCNVLNRTVAVKMLRNDLEGGDEFVKRFNAEAQSAACLAHPNIVSIYDVGEENGLYYIVMEYIEGTTLKEYIKAKGKISSLESAEIASQICAALTVAHEKNIIHRDIKPHNIMVTSNNLVKVTDFGIARASNNATMQVGDSILGSVHYISPEQARGGYVDGRTDIYSLGIVLYEMLTGKVPFESESPIAIAMKHLEEMPVAPKTLSPDISCELQEIVLKAISKETRKRYQSVSAMKSDLDVIINMLKSPQKDDAQTEVDNIVADNPDNTRKIPIQVPIADITEEDIAEDIVDEPKEKLVNDEEHQEVDFQYDEEVYDDYDEDEPRGLSFNTIFAAIIIALFVVGGASLVIGAFVFPDAPFYTMVKAIFGDNDVDVPAFVGKQYTEAQSLASQYGLELQVGESDFGPEPNGVVTDQTIAEGTSVKRGTLVTIYTSKGPDPDLFNTSNFKGESEDVIDKYKNLGYSVEKKSDTDKSRDKGEILRVSLKGNKIIFYINSIDGEDDEENVKVPNLKGLTVNQARAKLEDAGLLLYEEDEYDTKETKDVAEGKVASQSETPGTTVKPKTEIKIYLAVKPKDDQKEPESKKKTITLDLSAFTSSTHIKIVEPSGKVVYDKTVDASSQREVTTTLEGKGTVKYIVYINGEQYCEYPVIFGN